MRFLKQMACLFFICSLSVFASCGGSSSTAPPPPNPGPSPDPGPEPGPTPTASCTSGQRHFTMWNNTSQEIWVGITAGTISCLGDGDCPVSAAGSCIGANPSAGAAGTCGCAGGSNQCGSISQCKTSDNFCYWNLPSLTKSQINLVAGAKSTLCFPNPPTGKDIQWSGNIFARTGCDSNGQNCKTGDCGANSSGICPVGTGGDPPTTLFEFTLSNQVSDAGPPGFDYYDVSIINGINVGIWGVPAAGTYVPVASDLYSCQAPGSATASGGLSACSWASVNPVVSGTNYTTLLRNVLPTSFTGRTCPDGSAPNSLGYCVCTVDSNCSSQSLVCGLALNASSSKFTQVCGTFLAWWTADSICGASINTSTPYGAPLNCTSTITNSDSSTSTYTNLFLCTKPSGASNPEQSQSCYTNGAVTDCCGCATSASSPLSGSWPTPSSSFAGSDNGCYNHNSQWISIAQPWLVFLKQSCPTAYSYPFDDATSTFTCKGNSSTGPPSYRVTFLPIQ